MVWNQYMHRIRYADICKSGVLPTVFFNMIYHFLYWATNICIILAKQVLYPFYHITTSPIAAHKIYFMKRMIIVLILTDYFSVFMTTEGDGVMGILHHIAVGGVVLELVSFQYMCLYISSQCKCDRLDKFIPLPELQLHICPRGDVCVSLCQHVFLLDDKSLMRGVLSTH